jgi:hypothetical protein
MIDQMSDAEGELLAIHLEYDYREFMNIANKCHILLYLLTSNSKLYKKRNSIESLIVMLDIFRVCNIVRY